MAKNYNIQKFRFLCALMVVYIHASTFMNKDANATLINYYLPRRMSDLAVIFFFSVTGYFIASHNDLNKIKKAIIKNLNLYVFATLSLIFMRFTTDTINIFLFTLPAKTTYLKIVGRFSLLNLIIGEFINSSLWYLSASVISLSLMYYLTKFKVSDFGKVVLVFFLYIISKYTSIDIRSITPYGGFITGLLCMTMGYMVFKYSLNYKFSLLISGFSLFIGALISIKVYSLLFFFLMFSSFMLLSFCKYNPGKESIISKLGSLSTSIYIFHVTCISVVNIVWAYFGWVKVDSYFIYIVVVLISSVIFSPFLFKLCTYIYSKFSAILFKKNDKVHIIV